MIINMNTMCKVHLNDFGKIIWLSQVDSLPPEIRDSNPEIVTAIKSAINPEDNSVETELWKIFNIFGRYITPQQSPFRIETIEVNKNPLFK